MESASACPFFPRRQRERQSSLFSRNSDGFSYMDSYVYMRIHTYTYMGTLGHITMFYNGFCDFEGLEGTSFWPRMMKNIWLYKGFYGFEGSSSTPFRRAPGRGGGDLPGDPRKLFSSVNELKDFLINPLMNFLRTFSRRKLSSPAAQRKAKAELMPTPSQRRIYREG